jgi:hypothetical protein
MIVLPNFLGNIMPKYLGRQIINEEFLGVDKQKVRTWRVK